VAQRRESGLALFRSSTARRAAAASSHPDCHRRPLSSTGSTPAAGGRGSRAVTAGGELRPAPETCLLRHQQRTPGAPDPRALLEEPVGAAVQGVAGALLALGHVLELGGGGDQLPVVGEGALGAGGDAEGDRDDREAAQLALAVLQLDRAGAGVL